MMRCASSSAWALMSSASFCAAISVLFRLRLVLAVLVQDRLHAGRSGPQPVGLAERLLVVVGDRHQERRDLDLVEASNDVLNRCCRRSRGLTFMDLIALRLGLIGRIGGVRGQA